MRRTGIYNFLQSQTKSEGCNILHFKQEPRSLLDCDQHYTWTDTKDSPIMQIPLPEGKVTRQSVIPKGTWALEATAQPELINKF